MSNCFQVLSSLFLITWTGCFWEVWAITAVTMPNAQLWLWRNLRKGNFCLLVIFVEHFHSISYSIVQKLLWQYMEWHSWRVYRSIFWFCIYGYMCTWDFSLLLVCFTEVAALLVPSFCEYYSSSGEAHWIHGLYFSLETINKFTIFIVHTATSVLDLWV